MAKAKRAEPSRGELVTTSQKLSLTPAPIVQAEAQTINIPTPTEFQGGEEVSTLCPMAVFNEDTKPGQYISGVFRGFKEVDIEGRTSRIYLLDIGGGETVGVWGSTALDNQFDFGTPKPKEGDKILIQYLGLGQAKKGQNAPKLFRVKVAR